MTTARAHAMSACALSAMLACGACTLIHSLKDFDSRAGVTDPADAGDSGTAEGGTPRTTDRECETPPPEWLFCSGFEEGSKTVWNDPDDSNPDTEVGIVAHVGPRDDPTNHVARMGRIQGGADLVKLLPSQHDRVYARWYVFYEPGFDFGNDAARGGLLAGDPIHLDDRETRPSGDWYSAFTVYDTDLNATLLASYYRGMSQQCPNPTQGCFPDLFPLQGMPPLPTSGVWSCIEILLDGGVPSDTGSGATGQLDMWIDGKESGPFSNLWMRTTADAKVSSLRLGLVSRSFEEAPSVLYDDVVVSTAPIGCHAAR
jgi:hypothetical protein